jgi:hypothetical protein
MINYGAGIGKTNKSLKEMNKKGKFLMGTREMPVAKAASTKSSTSPSKKVKK